LRRKTVPIHEEKGERVVLAYLNTSRFAARDLGSIGANSGVRHQTQQLNTDYIPAHVELTGSGQ